MGTVIALGTHTMVPMIAKRPPIGYQEADEIPRGVTGVRPEGILVLYLRVKQYPNLGWPLSRWYLK